MERHILTIWTDGSCNCKDPEKLGGSGVYIQWKDKEYCLSKGYSETRIGRREAEAFLMAIKVIKKNVRCTAIFHIDSQYVINMLKNHYFSWKLGTLQGANLDLWDEIFKEVNGHKKLRIKLFWVKGHQKDLTDPIVYGNHVADELANYKNHIEYEVDNWE